jgi:hypothetical protein
LRQIGKGQHSDQFLSLINNREMADLGIARACPMCHRFERFGS